MKAGKKIDSRPPPAPPPPAQVIRGLLDPSSMLHDAKVQSGLRRMGPRMDAEPRHAHLSSSFSSSSSSPSSSSASATAAVSAPASQYTSLNPLDRMCEALLPWRILHDIHHPPDQNPNPARHAADDPSTLIPQSYATYELYVRTWEPLLLEEIRAQLLSGVEKSTDPRKARQGAVNVFSDEGSEYQGHSIRLSWNPVRRHGGSAGVGCGSRDGGAEGAGGLSSVDQSGRGGGGFAGGNLQAFDLVLLSCTPAPLPLTAQSVQRLVQDGTYFLALATASGGQGGPMRGLQIKANRKCWLAFTTAAGSAPALNPPVQHPATITISTAKVLPPI